MILKLSLPAFLPVWIPASYVRYFQRLELCFVSIICFTTSQNDADFIYFLVLPENGVFNSKCLEGVNHR